MSGAIETFHLCMFSVKAFAEALAPVKGFLNSSLKLICTEGGLAAFKLSRSSDARPNYTMAPILDRRRNLD